jgi:hypothetical protein
MNIEARTAKDLVDAKLVDVISLITGYFMIPRVAGNSAQCFQMKTRKPHGRGQTELHILP